MIKWMIGAGLVFFGWRFFAGPRILSRADLPKIRELHMLKNQILRDINLCAARQSAKGSLLSPSETIGAIAGLFAGAASLSFKTGLTAARKVAAGTARLDGRPVTCPDLSPQIARHDALSAELGLDPNLSPKDMEAIAASLGGYDTSPKGHQDKPETVAW